MTEEVALNKADTAFILASAGPVLLMTPGLATITSTAGFVGPNSAIIVGLLAGNPGQLFVPLKGAVIVSVYAFVVS